MTYIYFHPVYHGHVTLADSLSLEKIQNRAARLITGAFRRTSTKSLLQELGWTTLRVRRDISILNMLHKIKRSAPRYLLDVIPATRQHTTARTLRNSNNISLPPNRLSSFKNSFFPATIRRWNRIPEEVKTGAFHDRSTKKILK